MANKHSISRHLNKAPNALGVAALFLQNGANKLNNLRLFLDQTAQKATQTSLISNEVQN